MQEERTDVLVIGTGPGGEGAAMKAAKNGRRVMIVERFHLVGGGCTHSGTIPSKAFKEAVRQYVEVRSSPLVQTPPEAPQVVFPRMQRYASMVVERQVGLRRGFYERNGVPVVHGQARFVEPHAVEIERGDAGPLRVRFDHAVIATGSRPYRAPDVDFSHPRVRTSDTLLALERAPTSLVIYGAGVIGCEYASIFRSLGLKVDLVNSRDKLLAFLDDEIIDALGYHLRDQGALLRHDETYDRVEATDDEVVLHLRSGKRIRGDVLLWAQGRTGNSDDLGLARLDITPNVRGSIEVDEHYRTPAQAHIYAVGDIVGYPSLASAAYDQGRYAATHLVGEPVSRRLVDLIPTGIYTLPEISSLGRTERELTAARVPYEVGHSQFRHLARAQITGVTVGMLKILFHRETLEILGIHCFGHQAAEIIHIGQAVMAQQGPANSLAYFVDATFNYPTMAEAYRVAALNGLNRL